MRFVRLQSVRNWFYNLRHSTQTHLESSPIRLGLSFKLLVIIVGVSFIGVVASSVIVLELHHRQLIDNAQLATNRLSNVIQAGLAHAMLRNDRTTTSEIVSALANKEGVDHLRILDAQGVVQVSSMPGEVGETFDYSEPSCQFCHTG
ncbi:MAG TPA: hypothetical protein VF932_05945, partial [Anaerolineae bacterium]